MIIQARMTSSRLPGKILKPILGEPMLSYQLTRLKHCRKVDQIMVATTTRDKDDGVAALAESLNISVFRGSEDDVLDRYYRAAKTAHAETVVRVTSDCPLMDPAIVDQVITRYQDAEGVYDYVSNTLERTFPRGMDTEVFSFKALEEAAGQADVDSHREHVTPFLYTQAERYRLGQVLSSSENLAQHRWTVDTPEDFELVRRILTALHPENPQFTLADIIALLAEHPDWPKINAHIEQIRHSL